jgi:hypothetical protein
MTRACDPRKFHLRGAAAALRRDVETKWSFYG